MSLDFKVLKIDFLKNELDKISVHVMMKVSSKIDSENYYNRIHFYKNGKVELDTIGKLIDIIHNEFVYDDGGNSLSSVEKATNEFFSKIINTLESYNNILKLKNDLLNEVLSFDLNEYAFDYSKFDLHHLFRFKVNDNFVFNYSLNFHGNKSLSLSKEYNEINLLFSYNDHEYKELIELDKKVKECHKFRIKYLLDKENK